MASNRVSDGLTKTVTLGSGETGVAVGAFYLTGDIGGVVTSLTRGAHKTDINPGTASAEGDVAVIHMKGVWKLPKKASTAIGDGVKLYWDPGDSGKLTPTAGSLKEVGWAHGAALSADDYVNLKLKG